MVTIGKTTILLLISVFLVSILANIAHAEPRLMVQDFELKSVDVDNEVKPAEVLTISFSVVNTANETFENIQTDMWFEKSSSVKLHDNNDDIIRPSFDLNDIDAGDDKSVDYDLTIPWDVKNGERYEIIVRMKGRNSTSNMIQTFQETIGSFKIVKENTELYLNASFNPLRVTCGDDADLHIAVRDIGGNDESGVNLTAVNKVIGIEIRELFDMSYDFSDETNLFDKTYSFTVNKNMNPGKYELTVRADYDGGYKEALQTINMTVDCVPAQVQPTQPTQPSNPSNNQSQTQPVNPGNSGTQPGTTMPVQPAATAKKTTDMTQLIIIIVAGEVAIILIVLLVFLLTRKKKKPQQSPPMY